MSETLESVQKEIKELEEAIVNLKEREKLLDRPPRKFGTEYGYAYDCTTLQLKDKIFQAGISVTRAHDHQNRLEDILWDRTAPKKCIPHGRRTVCEHCWPERKPNYM